MARPEVEFPKQISAARWQADLYLIRKLRNRYVVKSAQLTGATEGDSAEQPANRANTFRKFIHFRL
jgi:hypothetical protein